MITWFALVAVAALPAQGVSLIEMARLNGGKASISVDVDGPIGTVQMLAEEAELILIGRIDSTTVRLSADESRVLTGYSIAPIHVLKGTVGVSDRPQPASLVRVQRGGGTVHVDGLEISESVNIFPEAECLKTGEMAFMFLTRDEREPGTYLFHHGEGGAFRIVTGQVIAMTKAAAHARGEKGMPLDAFIAEVSKYLR